MVGIFLIELRRIDSEFLQQPVGHRTVRVGAVDQQRAAIQQLKPSAEVKLVAFGMASEIVVVFQNQDASRFSSLLAKEVGGRQTADASSDDHEIVCFPGIDGLTRGIARMSHREGCERFRKIPGWLPRIPSLTGG